MQNPPSQEWFHPAIAASQDPRGRDPSHITRSMQLALMSVCGPEARRPGRVIEGRPPLDL
ncbi:MAG: hypothetical protein KME20_26695 [Kaiparowitsia implicata GSE-PSE-MK54-09C]|nr:hypothetical protein [Kaiparowitsia implicata GSE-PSE-MK54-09C]